VPILEGHSDIPSKSKDKCRAPKSERGCHGSIEFISDGKMTKQTHYDGGKLRSSKKCRTLSRSNATPPFQQPNVLRGLRISRSGVFNNGSMKLIIRGGRFTSIAIFSPSDLPNISLVTKSRKW